MESIRLNVLLDLDGTLTDSRPGIFACLRHVLDKLGHESPSDADLQQFIGPPLRDIFAQLLSCERDADCVGVAMAAYHERFAKSGMFENSVYDRVPQALDALKASGARLHLATSKPRVFAQRILEHFGLASRFEGIYGGELDGSLCDKSELIAHVLASAQLKPHETMMIGDRHHDIVGAFRNHVLPVGVLWGYGSRQELSTAGAKVLLADPSEMPGLLSARL
jgi:phosphoglycolate phosphatase